VERGLSSLSGVSLLGLPFQVAAVPQGFRPRGAPDPGSTTRSRVDPDDARASRTPTRGSGPSMSLLPETGRGASARSQLDHQHLQYSSTRPRWVGPRQALDL
jgi:hypothetical protein